MANCDCNPPARCAQPERSASLEDFDEALSEAHFIGRIIGHLALAEIGGHGKIDASAFDWLADELGGRLERIDAARKTLLRGAAA